LDGKGGGERRGPRGRTIRVERRERKRRKMQTEDNRKFGGVGVGKNTRRKDATKEQEHIMHENN
jgi:hypothetical protein